MCYAGTALARWHGPAPSYSGGRETSHALRLLYSGGRDCVCMQLCGPHVRVRFRTRRLCHRGGCWRPQPYSPRRVRCNRPRGRTSVGICVFGVACHCSSRVLFLTRSFRNMGLASPATVLLVALALRPLRAETYANNGYPKYLNYPKYPNSPSI